MKDIGSAVGSSDAETTNSPIRILHVLSAKGFSGGENQLAAIVRHLHAVGHEQSFVLQPGAPFAQIAREVDAPVTTLRMANDVDLFAIARLRRLLRSGSADVVSYACARGHKLGSLASLGLGSLPPRLVTRRMDYPLSGSFKRWLYRSAVQGVITISEAVHAQVLGLGVDPERVHLIHEGVASDELARLRTPEQRAAARRELGAQSGELLGVTLASLHERKGIDVLLRAIEGLELPAGLRLRWLVGGEGPLQADLEAQAAAASGGDREVRLLGQVDAQRLLCAGDLFCLPSRLEGLGVALLEAMAAGLPAVASRVGGMQDSLVDGETGYFAEPGDVESLRSALSRLVASPELRVRLGAAAARRAAEHFDVQEMCIATEKVYRELARGRERRSR